VREIRIEAIRPNPHQPRRNFNETELSELADSIRTHGVLQPVLVCRRAGGYELVSGERRLKASQLAGLENIPAILVNPGDSVSSLTIALVENVQRADLGVIELAQAYKELQNEFGRTQDEIARTVGKSRPHVANTLSLLELSPHMREAVSNGKITAGHARALLMVDKTNRDSLFKRMVNGGISVRAAENAARTLAKRDEKRATGKLVDKSNIEDDSINLILRDMESAVESALKRKCNIQRTARGRGKMVLEFYSDRDLEVLVEKIRSK